MLLTTRPGKVVDLGTNSQIQTSPLLTGLDFGVPELSEKKCTTVCRVAFAQ